MRSLSAAIATAKNVAALDERITDWMAARRVAGWWIHLLVGAGGRCTAALVWVPDTGPPAVEVF